MTVQTLAIVVLLVSFFVMIFLRFPIAYAVGLSSVLCLMVQGHALSDVCRLMVKGISSFSLMAVPFFITMGVLMGSGGISEKLIALADACVGWMRGGMAMVNIVASYFFGGISGSASADTASIGSIMIPMMVDQGYDADFSTAVTITSSCEGLLVPPSHNMVIYATTAGGISVGSLFLAGYLPGALLAIVLMIGSYIISVKENYPKGSPFTIKGFIKQLGTSIWALAAVVIVVFGVVGGVFTATESAAIAVIYSLLVSVFVYKGLDWKGVWHALDECVNTLSIVLILIATSAVFGNCLTMLHVPDLAANAITSVTSNPYIIALLIDLIILVLGCIMDMAPIILIATPILLPIATSIGIDPIQFPGLKVSVTSDESRAINTDPVPKVIISASGMCEAGRIRHHLKHNLWRKECTILFVGYQAVNTLGRSLLEGADNVKLFGESIEVQAEICQLTGLSGHADREGLLKWVNSFEPKPKRVFIVHGEDEVENIFAQTLTEQGFNACAPYNGEQWAIGAEGAVCLKEGTRIRIEHHVSEGAARAATVFQRLLNAGKRLLRVIEHNEGGANKDLAKFADQINALCDKWDR